MTDSRDTPDKPGLSARHAFLDSCLAQSREKPDLSGEDLLRLHEMAGEPVPGWLRDPTASYGMMGSEIEDLVGAARERLNNLKTEILAPSAIIRRCGTLTLIRGGRADAPKGPR